MDSFRLNCLAIRCNSGVLVEYFSSDSRLIKSTEESLRHNSSIAFALLRKRWCAIGIFLLILTDKTQVLSPLWLYFRWAPAALTEEIIMVCTGLINLSVVTGGTIQVCHSLVKKEL